MRTIQLLRETLKGLEKVIIPSPNGHHAITYARYGSDSRGWEDKLALQVNAGGVFHCFFLEDGDLDGTPAQIIDRIVEQFQARTPRSQWGVSGVQYTTPKKPDWENPGW